MPLNSKQVMGDWSSCLSVTRWGHVGYTQIHTWIAYAHARMHARGAAELRVLPRNCSLHDNPLPLHRVLLTSQCTHAHTHTCPLLSAHTLAHKCLQVSGPVLSSSIVSAWGWDNGICRCSFCQRCPWPRAHCWSPLAGCWPAGPFAPRSAAWPENAGDACPFL